MPTVLRTGPYRLYFFSHEPNEPAHVHVDRDRATAKFWLAPISLARNVGFRSAELHIIERRIRDNQTRLLRAWNETFKS
jgi:hypothetical protein